VRAPRQDRRRKKPAGAARLRGRHLEGIRRTHAPLLINLPRILPRQGKDSSWAAARRISQVSNMNRPDFHPSLEGALLRSPRGRKRFAPASEAAQPRSGIALPSRRSGKTPCQQGVSPGSIGRPHRCRTCYQNLRTKRQEWIHKGLRSIGGQRGKSRGTRLGLRLTKAHHFARRLFR